MVGFRMRKKKKQKLSRNVALLQSRSIYRKHQVGCPPVGQALAYHHSLDLPKKPQFSKKINQKFCKLKNKTLGAINKMAKLMNTRGGLLLNLT